MTPPDIGMLRRPDRRRLFAALCGGWALAAAACSDTSAPESGVRADVTFAQSQHSGQILPDSAGIQVAGGLLEIAGVFTTADPCRAITGESAASGNRVVITMSAERFPPDGGCHAVVGRFDYLATVAGLSAGSWVVEVWHRAYGEGAAEVVGARTVQIPWIP